MSEESFELIDKYWRAANYLSVGQIYLYDNPLLKKPITIEHIKPRLLGHWGTTPGLNFIYVHLNRIIRERRLKMIYIAGPGHGGPGLVANAYLEGTYSEVYPNIAQSEEGMKRLFTQFSFPGGIPSHVAPETPGSIHEGGELGYSLAHAYGAVFDNPDLVAACVVGDGEAETGPLATSWHSNKFLNPASDGAVLPILHLNGYKIANPTVLARISEEELKSLFVGYGYKPYFVQGDDPATMHPLMASTLDKAMDDIAAIQKKARTEGFDPNHRPAWPMIVLRTPKGWTGPKTVDAKQTEGSWRSHQVPFSELAEKPEHVKLLETWLKSYRAEELFDESGKLKAEIAAMAPKGELRMSASPYANGGLLLKELDLGDFTKFAVEVEKPGTSLTEATRVMGQYLADVMKRSAASRNFRIVGPDETNSNRLGAVIDAVPRAWDAETLPGDDRLSPEGRVMEVLSEHLCQGWLEGYLLTGRHGLFSCYEAFIHIVDSMVNQHAKWLKTTRDIPWRRPIASLNYLLTSHVWRQDHNGFSHQDPGFIDHIVNKKADVVRVYLPPDANTLLSVTAHCLASKNYINVIVAGKQPALQYLDMDAADQALHPRHRHLGLGLDRPGRRAGRSHGLCGRRPDHGDPRGRGHLEAEVPGPPDPRDQRRRPHEAPAERRASARAVRPRLRHALHDRQAGRLRLPRLSLADTSPDLPPARARQYPRARLQGGGNHDDTLRHDGAERGGPLPSGGRRDRPRAQAGDGGRLRQAVARRQAHRAQGLYPQARRRHAGYPRLEVALLGESRNRRQISHDGPKMVRVSS